MDRLIALFLVFPVACGVSGTFADERDLAAECDAQATMTQEINLSSGVYNEDIQVSSPLTMEVTMGVDSNQRQNCLEFHGIAPESASEAYVERAASCREKIRAQERVHLVRAGTVALGTDASAYQECMRGTDADIEVEVDFPDAAE